MNKTTHQFPVHGAGLGLRRGLVAPLAETPPTQVGFMEVAPENWLGVGGLWGKRFREFTERYPFICHGLSLSIGGPTPLDEAFLHKLKQFIKEHNIRCYSEHLSYCSDDGHLYDLMPIPFTEEAVRYVAERIKRVQDILEQPLVMENVSYYAAPGREMSEIDFITAVLEEADCPLLLDVNNIYVNSVNHQEYTPQEFLQAMPAERITYLHIAGHYNEAEDLIVDTHGADVIDPVWQILEQTYAQFGVIPTLLERDFNLPPVAELLGEVDTIIHYQQKWSDQHDKQRQQN
ncbi:MAG: DUF692 domain-containing protein [Gammaproteobacteria bacterium]